jgi:hypothetical protein
MSDNIDIQKLLRLKRYEKPEPEYFDNFLREFQRRQRSELLKRSLWQIVCDRTNAFLGHFSLTQYAYGVASAAVLVVAGLMSANIISDQPGASKYAEAATHDQAGISTVPGTALVPPPDQFGNQLDFANDGQMLHASINSRPRYVIDARPVSYEAPFSF